jgi:hypothetical protein
MFKIFILSWIIDIYVVLIRLENNLNFFINHKIIYPALVLSIVVYFNSQETSDKVYVNSTAKQLYRYYVHLYCIYILLHI